MRSTQNVNLWGAALARSAAPGNGAFLRQRGIRWIQGRFGELSALSLNFWLEMP